VTRTFPKYVPLPILTRNGVTATADINAQQLTIDLGTRLFGSSTTIPLAAAFNISVSNSSITTKTANRDLYVKIYPANNSTGFGYSAYGSGVDGYFNSGSNTVSNTTTANFSAGQRLRIQNSGQNFLANVGVVINSTAMNLTSTVNFTGNADIYRAVNLNGPWCLGVPDIFRLKAVYIANTSAVNTSSIEVTRDFVIDHNHTTNYADLGFLVKNRDSSLVIGPNDYILVKFDAFTRNYEDRPVHINSYVSANSTTRANTDAKSIAELNNSYINTFEIPEIHAAGGTNYDMISHIDFRPKVANTANLATTVAGATLNPAYTTTFSATNKKFPVPDSNMSFTTEYFLGRIDTVYIGSDGRIGTSRGHPYPTTILNSKDPDELLTPVPSKNTMILNYIKVPAYPSLEENAAASINRVVNKSVINDVKLTRRQSSKRVTRLLTQQDIAIEQPRRYSMEDIGSLERRIKDLEYYVSLSNLELSTKDLNLPSSIASNINRFKFGFFADAFDDRSYTDIDSVEYSASIEKKRAVPPYELIKIELPGGEGPYTDFSVVSQDRATGNDLPICVARADYQETQGREVKTGNQRISTAYFTMANNLGADSGVVNIYMYFYSGADVMRVYQSTTANNFGAPFLTTGSSTPLSTADQNYMSALPDGFFKITGKYISSRDSLSNHQKVSSPANGMRYGGKLTFNHNPANGRFYKIEVTNHSIIWRYRIEYPINVTCSTTPAPTNPGGIARYDGTMFFKGVKDVKVSKKNAGEATYYRIHFTAAGLKPSTKHKVLFSKQDLTHLCDTSVRDTVVPIPPFATTGVSVTWAELSSQIPDFFNDAPNGFVMTDAKGQIEAYLYVLQDQNLDVPAKKQPKDDYEKVEKPVIEIYSTDGSSYAQIKTQLSFKLFSGFREI
jgi:hypothetical protein